MPERSNRRVTLCWLWVLKCLQVNNRTTYDHIVEELESLTKQSQAEQRVERESKLFLKERTFRHDRHCMLVFRLIDDRGSALGDYDLYLTAGPSYSRNDLPVGFFTDRQRNQRNPGKLTYYLNFDQLEEGLQDPLSDRHLQTTLEAGQRRFRVGGLVGGWADRRPPEQADEEHKSE
jgi:hypothetical protein